MTPSEELAANREARVLSRTVIHLIDLGAFDTLERVLPKYQSKVAAANALSAHAALIARAEATLYRFGDADPRRAKRARALLEIADEDGDARVAESLLDPMLDAEPQVTERP
jgi:2,3-bisphosphoglycerate-independent phosphoglycerate mutase